jgi:hypothetical protein
MKSVWSDEGTPNVQRSSLERHSLSKDHATATKLYLHQHITKTNSESLTLSPELTEASVSDQDAFLFRTVYCVAKNEMPSEKVNDLLELQTLNKVDLEYKNLNWTTITEIQ